MSNTHLLVGMAHRAHEDRDCIRSYLRSRSQSRSEASLQRVLKRSMGQAIADFSMLADGDHVMVCMSGGKDSFALLDLLLRLREHAPIDYHLTAVHINQMQPDYPQGVLPQYFQRLGVAYRCVDKDTYSIVIDTLQPNDTMCSLCSRLRRGVLYTMANEIGATKIALGHHRDDLVETLFLNMFHGGRMKTMAPKLQSDNGQHIVIRPLAYCKEKDLMRYAKIQQFPIIPCNLCGSQDNLERLHIKNMLREWEKEHPQRINNIFRSMQHLTPSHLLDDTYFDFNALHTNARDHESAVLDMDLFVPSVAAGKATTQQRMFRPVRMRNDDIQTIAHYQRAVQRAQHEEQTCAHKEKNI